MKSFTLSFLFLIVFCVRAQLNTCQHVEVMKQTMIEKLPQYKLVGGGAQKVNDSTYLYEYWNVGGPPNDTLFSTILYLAQNDIIISYGTYIHISLLLNFTQIIDKIAIREIISPDGCGIYWSNKYATYCIKFDGTNMFSMAEWKK